jgi:PAS domain S-box-containing protein
MSKRASTVRAGDTAALLDGGGWAEPSAKVDDDLIRLVRVAVDATGMARGGIFLRDGHGRWRRAGSQAAPTQCAFCERVVASEGGFLVESGSAPGASPCHARDTAFRVATAMRAADGAIGGVFWVSDRTEHAVDARMRRLLDDVAASAAALVTQRAAARMASVLTEILEIAPFGVTVFDEDGKLVLHNRWHEALSQPFALESGMTSEDVLAEGLARRRYPAAYGREAAWLAERLALRDACATFELELAGNQWRLAHERRTSDGLGVTFQTDITDYKQQRLALGAALRQSENIAAALQAKTRELERVAEMSGLGGWEYSPDAAGVTLDAVLRRILDVDESVAPTLEQAIEFYAPRSRPAIAAAMNAAIREGAPFDLELQIDTARGRRFWVRTVGRAEMSRGRVVRVSGSIQDIDERKRHEIEIERIRARFEAIFEKTDSVVFIKRRDGALLAANKKYHLAAGRDDVIGKTDYDLYPGESADHLRSVDKRVFETGEPFVGEEDVIIASGEKVTYLTSKFLIMDPAIGDRVLCGLATDITAQKRLQQSLEESRIEAEQANAVKSQFLATMSHEIRTPMNGVLGMLALLLSSDLDARQRMQATVARDSAKGLLQLLNDILDYSKLEAREVELEATSFDPRDVFHDVIALQEGAASDKGLALACEIAAGMPACVRGDPMRLRQILGNLLANAVKFTEKGAVRVVADYAPEGVLKVAIADTGIGIPPEVQATLFKRFHQADASTTRRFGGTGLGLAICRQLVEAMGGEIGVESAEGCGATFRFAVPMPRATPPAAQ